MNILILGGTGVIGKGLVYHLSKKGHICYVTSRSEYANSNNIIYLKGNPHNSEFRAKILGMFCWDAIVDFMRYGTKSFTCIVPDYLKATKQYIMLSSARVYAESETPLTEQSSRLLDVCKDIDYIYSDEYALSKAREENYLFHSGTNNWTIIRPYITYSQKRLQLTSLEKEIWLRRAVEGKKVIISEELLDKTTTMTSGFDVSNGIASIIGRQEAHGKIFHITSPTYYKWSDIASMYSEILSGYDVKLEFYRVKGWMSVMSGSIYQYKYDRSYNRIFDNTAISAFCNIEDFSDFRDSITKIIKDSLLTIENVKINWELEGKMDRLTGDLSRFKTIPGYKNKIKYYLNRFIKLNT